MDKLTASFACFGPITVRLRDESRPSFVLVSKKANSTLIFLLGGLSIAVPGEVRGLYEAWKRYGRLRWEKLVQPAINLSRTGFNITEALLDALNTTKGIEKDIRNDPGLRSVYITCVSTAKANSF